MTYFDAVGLLPFVPVSLLKKRKAPAPSAAASTNPSAPPPLPLLLEDDPPETLAVELFPTTLLSPLGSTEYILPLSNFSF